MKVNRYIYLIGAICLAAPFASQAQDLDPTVVVDRAYEGKLMEVHKPALEMAVPDTVTRFDLDFDYSVFDSPYKGSYEFNPYLLSMKPSASSDGSRKFFLRAGAGYQLHPELDMVWSPDLKTDDFAMDVFARHKSFIGNYHNLDGQGNDAVWAGYDLKSTAGFAGYGDWESGYADFWGSYSNLATKDRMWNRMYNTAEVGLSIGSKDLATYVDYRVDAKYRHGHDAVRYTETGPDPLKENAVDLDVSAGFPVRGSMLFFDVEADFAGYGGKYSATAGQLGITPHYVYRRSRFMADIGVKFAKTMGNDGELRYDDAGNVVEDLHNQNVYSGVSLEQIVYPDVTVEFGIIREALRLRLHAGGGNRLDTWASVLEGNHHVAAYTPDFTIERINVMAALEGSIASRFSYSIYGGYASYANGLLDRIDLTVAGHDRALFATMGHAAYSRAFAGLDFLWKSDALMIDGNVEYSDARGDAFDNGFVRPAAVSGDVAVEYNWKRRIIAGADCRFASARESVAYELPAYADLGLYAEYVFARGFSLWARGGNLLGMTVQYNPLYAEKGAYFTLGICLNL